MVKSGEARLPPGLLCWFRRSAELPGQRQQMQQQNHGRNTPVRSREQQEWEAGPGNAGFELSYGNPDRGLDYWC